MNLSAEKTEIVKYTINLKLKKQDTTFFGPGPASLLDIVEEGASLHQAAARLGMSYSKAWRIVRTAERQLGFALLESTRGGANGGGSMLTERARLLLARYRQFEKEIYAQGDKLFAKYFGDLS